MTKRTSYQRFLRSQIVIEALNTDAHFSQAGFELILPAITRQAWFGI